ncbi:hypothetical protein F4810DRAFT_530600 [Camillea tinctor]|nr:hypothetical protein F4810DRAFT_530600 [Camillea tinctor]
MPTATSYFGYALTNLGPLTTTFSAAPSCATAANVLYYVNASNTAEFYGRPSCSPGPWADACYPSGAALDALESAYWAAPTRAFAHYYSPGVACPAGWTTAGVGSHVASAPGALTGDGVFTRDPWSLLRQYRDSNATIDAFLPLVDVYLDVLDPAETLVFCCPSGYNAGVYGRCASSVAPLTSYSTSDICFVDYPDVDYVTVSTTVDELLTVNIVTATATATGDALTTSVYSFTNWYHGEATEVAVASLVPAVALVHQASDLPSSGVSLFSGPSVLLTLLLPLWLLIGVATRARMVIR